MVLDLDGSNAVTMRRVVGSGFDDLVAREDASGVVKWYGTDHLGSVRAIFDNSGGVSNAVDYEAFGGILSGVNVDRYSWTGREADALTGLRHNRAREYDPAIGRWMSEDPIGFAAGDVNLFRYVGNAYTITTDPSGYVWPFSAVVGGVIGAVAGAVGQVVGNAINGKSLGEGVVGAAVGGAVAWALIGAAGPVGVAAIAGASAGATAIGAGVASTINQIEESGAVSVKKVAQDAAIGAVAGAVGGGVGGAVGGSVGIGASKGIVEGATKGAITGVAAGTAGGATGGYLGTGTLEGTLIGAASGGAGVGVGGVLGGGYVGGRNPPNTRTVYNLGDNPIDVNRPAVPVPPGQEVIPSKAFGGVYVLEQSPLTMTPQEFHAFISNNLPGNAFPTRLTVIETPEGSVLVDPSVPNPPPGTGHILPNSGARITAVFEIIYDEFGFPTCKRID